MNNLAVSVVLRKAIIVAIVFSCFWVIGCISVEDFGEYWDKGVIDPKLEGHWKSMESEHPSEDRYMSFMESDGSYRLCLQAAADYLTEEDDKSGTQVTARTLRAGRHTFLMGRMPEEIVAMSPKDKTESNVGGGLQLYKFDGDKLVLCHLDEKVLGKAIRQGKINGKISEDSIPSAAISKLDKKTMKFLVELANEPRNWDKTMRYQKVADLKQALKASRSYPASDDTPANVLVGINLPDLKYFAEGKKEILLRHLQASREWKVFTERGGIVCYRRRLEEGKWRVSLNGYYSYYKHDDSGETEWTQQRYLFRFSEEGGGPFNNRYNRASLTKVGPLAGATHLNLKSSRQGIESYLVIGQEGLWFEFFEETQHEPRKLTREALNWLQEFSKKVRKSEDVISQSGYDGRILPKDSVKKGKPSIEVADSFQPGIYDVLAWVNPGEQGITYLRVFDAKTNTPLSEKQIYGKSNELIGWSKDPGVLFFYNSHVTVYEGDWEHSYDARFELWHKSEKGGKEKKLAQTTRTIYGWQR